MLLRKKTGDSNGIRGESHHDPLRRRSRALIVFLAIAIVLSAGGLSLSSKIKSPAAIAAQTAPPSPSILTAPVLSQQISQTVVMRAHITLEHEYQVTPKTEFGASSLVITSINASVGDQIHSGQVIASVSGRPLFVLQGRVPGYRNISPGDQGPDVAELQQALAQLGFSTAPDTSGTFGSGTKRAILGFYAQIGYAAPTVDHASAMQAAEAADTTAEHNLYALEIADETENSALNEYFANPSSEVGSSTLVITGIDRPVGSTVRSGQLLASVSGRPLIVLKGPLAAYRNMSPGESGRDVAELQQALRDLGYQTSPDQVGKFGPGTERAISAFYKHLGFSPAIAGSLSAIQSAQATVTADEHNIVALQDELAAAESTTTTSPGEGIATLPAGTSGGQVPLATQITWAQEQLAADQASLSALKATYGPMIPQSEVLFIPKSPLKVVAISGTIGQSPGYPFITLAPVLRRGDPLSAAELDTGEASTSAGSTTGTNTGSGSNTSTNSSVSIGTQIEWAQQELQAANESVASLQSTSGPMVPLSEVEFLPSLPAHVVSLSGLVGEQPKSPFLTISAGSPLLVGQLDPSSSGLLHPGQSVRISDPAFDFEDTGHIQSISTRATTSGSDSGALYLPVTIRPNRAISESLVGQDVQVTVTAAHTTGAVLAVPLSALYTTVNGESYVTKIDSRDRQQRVPVVPGIIGDGLVQVTPQTPGALVPGVNVVTGAG